MMHEFQRPPLRVAMMGLGRAMFEDHFSVYKAHPALFKVVAACDLVKERRDRVAAVFPACKMFRQFNDMLDEHDIDLVDIATCTEDHVPHALESLRRGYWTLLEQPMALTVEDAQVLRGASAKAMNRLLMMNRGLFSAPFMLAKKMMSDPRLGMVHCFTLRQEDYVRRDDWQAVKRLGGGAAYYAMPDLVMQALKLLPLPPVQMWSELKRIASLGDAEDYAMLCFRTRSPITGNVIYNGGCLAPMRGPAVEIVGERGAFRVAQGASSGELIVIDPAFKLPRRRSSVRTPPLKDMHEDLPVVTIPIAFDRETPYGASAFWRAVYTTVRTGAAFPVSLEDSIEAVKFAQLMKKGSPFAR